MDEAPARDLSTGARSGMAGTAGTAHADGVKDAGAGRADRSDPADRSDQVGEADRAELSGRAEPAPPSWSAGEYAVDIGVVLRRLRRAADLSQRELAKRSQVPISTIARLEAGRSPDPRVRTLERLIFACDGDLLIVDKDGLVDGPIPHDDLRDRAGRHYPAHLDVREVGDPPDWWRAWWVGCYPIPKSRWPIIPPDHTFDLSRYWRDRRRRAE